MIHWPQFIYVVLMSVGLGLVLAKHGYPQPRYDFRMTFFCSVINFG
jgi:hypothetical protein